MSSVWDRLPRQHYMSLAPWCWVQLESGEAPGPFPFVAGIAPADGEPGNTQPGSPGSADASGNTPSTRDEE